MNETEWSNELLVQILARFERIEELLSQSQQPTGDRPLTLREAAKYLNISEAYLYTLTSGNRIRHYKPTGKKIFFKKTDLDEYLLQHVRKTKADIEAEALSYVSKSRYNKRKA